ncbi:unnamed protein product [Callosobruchus maculatus]|uniref:Tetraspanin n=1 Tax=Callosobruchus maculatus TaxID=64391 RepID=A0A653BS46_CALMS|nr:unnamed protein product [Callosobruchus maculatus]
MCMIGCLRTLLIVLNSILLVFVLLNLIGVFTLLSGGGATVYVMSFYLIYKLTYVILGIYGAARKKHRLVLAHAVMVAIFVVAACFLFLLPPAIDKNIRESRQEKFDKYTSDDDFKKEVDETQKRNECCGWDGPDYWTKRQQEIPDSCKDAKGVVYSKGCKEAVEEQIGWLQELVIVAASTLIVYNGIMMIIAFLLWYKLRKGEDTRESF